jgi:ribonucleotide reductase alpha subunit
MVILNVDHPDIEKFIQWKVKEERKVASLVAGSHMCYESLKGIMESAEKNGFDPSNNPELKKLILKAKTNFIPLNYIKRVLMLVENGVKASEFDFKTFDTDFNGQYMMNLLAGLEYEIGKSKKNSINVSSKFTYGGGKRYSPVDIAASNAVMDVVADNDKVNTLQFNPYNRLDLRIAYKINGKKAAYEIALDLVNLMNTKNVLALSYAPDPANINADPLIKNYQLGFLPLFYVKVDF